jgi:biopolymer transport protein ExbD
MSMSARTAPGRAIAAINVTPMADIMIVLLIIFMAITPLLDDDLLLPAASNAAKPRPGVDDVVVSIQADSSISLGDARLDNLGELALGLTELLEARPEGGRVVFLRADEGLAYSAVWDVMELCRQAGAVEVALLSRQKVGS